MESSFDVKQASNTWREAALAEERLRLVKSLNKQDLGLNQCVSYAEKIVSNMKCNEKQKGKAGDELLKVLMTTKEKDARSDLRRLEREKKQTERKIHNMHGRNYGASRKILK